MANPTPYVPTYSFAGWQATRPADPLPAQQVDIQFANIATALTQTQTALADVRRSDGKLPNSIVTYDTLSNDLRAEYTGGAVSAWAPVVPYVAGIAAQITAPATLVYYNGETYVAAVAHVTGGTFMPDNWTKLVAKAAGSGVGDMLAANNLSDVTDVAQARANLSVSTTAATLLKTGNLSGLSSTSTARNNLGVSATTATLLKADNLAGLANPATARTNLEISATNTPFDNTIAQISGNPATVQAAVEGVTARLDTLDRSFVSTNLPFGARTSVNVPFAPRNWSLRLVCLVANNGYLVDDEVDVAYAQAFVTSVNDVRGVTIRKLASGNVIEINTTGDFIYFRAADTSLVITAGSANSAWGLRLRVWG